MGEIHEELPQYLDSRKCRDLVDDLTGTLEKRYCIEHDVVANAVQKVLTASVLEKVVSWEVDDPEASILGLETSIRSLAMVTVWQEIVVKKSLAEYMCTQGFLERLHRFRAFLQRKWKFDDIAEDVLFDLLTDSLSAELNPNSKRSKFRDFLSEDAWWAYLYRSVLNGVGASLRKEERHREALADLQSGSLIHNEDTEEADSLDVHEALSHLSSEDQDVIEMWAWKGKTMRQIAAERHISLSTAMRRLQAAILRFRGYFRKS